jgi:2-polyprenyl-3-methyl-5-hydroxy-6-metoxy-1,4-benzoquinol methylase
MTAHLCTADEIMQLARGFQKSRVLLSAFELGIFTALGARQRSSREIAEALHTDPRATDRLLNALCALGLLAKHEGCFANTPATAEFLVQGNPGFLSYLSHANNLWQTWSTLTEAVRRGTSVADRPLAERGEQWREAFIAAMHNSGSRCAPEVVGLLELSGVSRVLDVGGGSGAYSMEFVRARPGIRPTVFDLPEILPLTRRYVADCGMTSMIDFLPGDLATADLGAGYDMVFVSSIVHMFSLADNQAFVAQCVAALNCGGQLVIKDFVVNEDRTQPTDAALFALNMLVGTAAGDTYTEREIRGWMEQAGLHALHRKDTSFGSALIVGRKP